MGALMYPHTPETLTAHRCKKCGVWREPFCTPKVPARHYADFGRGDRCPGEWEPVVYRLAGQATPEPVEDDENDACSPACFDDCDGSDEDGHVPAGTYDPNLSYGVNGR